MPHSLLAPSSADRWLHCPGHLPYMRESKDSGSEYAFEGTAAHSYLEKALKGQNYSDAEFIDSEMYNYVRESAEYLQGLMPCGVNSETQVKIFELGGYGDEGKCSGTVDAYGWKYQDKHLVVADFKYGRGVMVFAKSNPQMMLYAFGVLRKLEVEADDVLVELVVVQPRLNHYNSFAYTAKEIKTWVMTYAIPAAMMALSGLGHFTSGKWCRWCPLKTTCSANSHSFGLHKTLPAYEEISEQDRYNIAATSKEVIEWTKAVTESFEAEILAGKKRPGCRIETKLGRKTLDTDAAVAWFVEQGVAPEEYLESKVKALGKLKAYAEDLEQFIIIPETQVVKYGGKDE